ncbi:MAG: fibronectin type III domain-containing protein, partial [Sedimentisphaerales bacterium]|nr:fibronectin type III domain-containing protein [Sedimentisphaerales bacterium]
AVGDEPEPHGDRINMGAYGGTAYASKTPDGTGHEITFPNAVSNLTLSGGPQQLIVKWDDPNYDGGLPIEGYVIYRGPSVAELSLREQVAGNVHEYVDTEVLNGQTYFYAVSAVNGFGEGELCPAVQAKAQWHALDINGDGVIDMVDFTLFCKEWLWEAWWHD